MSQPLDWEAFRGLVAGAERVLLTTHVRPDGDALGSEMGMAALLAKLGKAAHVHNPSPTPPRYRFLDPDGTRFRHQTEDEPPAIDPDLIVVLDTGTWNQLAGFAPFVRQSRAKKVVIDHHRSQDGFADLTLVDSTAAACGTLVKRAFGALNVPLDRAAAEGLFLAISTDTGWMRHPNADAGVFADLSELVALGADPSALYRQLFETHSPGRVRLLALTLGTMELAAGGRLAVAHVSQEMIHAAGAHPMDTEDFIDQLRAIEGVELAALLIEQADRLTTKASFRSRGGPAGGVDCSRLAERFSGGGHAAAAGATLSQPLAEAVTAVLGAAAEALG